MRHSFATLCSLGNELCSLGKRTKRGWVTLVTGTLGGRQNSTRFPVSGMGAWSNFCRPRIVAAALRSPVPCLKIWLLEFSLCNHQAALWRVCQSRSADWMPTR